ncbi:hypothetical protein COHA_010110 [Chlorella ohadii]|uniref:Signal peptidase complex catalytic subunit SEC11 n=1 Tax=Chlorella ohadii TaxID=2649997 RepID=A0AAD5DH16_9CHLO|nr:hypothetical protein COHA_010110 [Chlorella ohadii]
MDFLSDIGRMNKRQVLLQTINLGMIITSALMIWKSLVLGTGSESPVVVVLSGSMEPGFYRGDILFLYQPKQPVDTGDIIVFNTDGREIPIVHRVIKVHQRADNASHTDILTKGDNNWGDDRSLYPKGQLWLNPNHIMGKVVGFLPHIGRVTIIMNDYPMFKYALIAKPQKLRQLLEQYAEIGRVYLAPEDPALRKKRKQKGGNSGKNFTEGWVEFEDKAKAKEVVAMLNGQQMGGKRRSAYFYDLWCMKYLPKFKWDHLTEEINYQKAVREQRLAAEISAAKRERDFYLSRVDKAKALIAGKKGRGGGGGSGGAD